MKFPSQVSITMNRIMGPEIRQSESALVCKARQGNKEALRILLMRNQRCGDVILTLRSCNHLHLFLATRCLLCTAWLMPGLKNG